MIKIINRLLLWHNGFRYEINMENDVVMACWMPIHINMLNRKHSISHYIDTDLIKRLNIFKKNNYEE